MKQSQVRSSLRRSPVVPSFFRQMQGGGRGRREGDRLRGSGALPFREVHAFFALAGQCIADYRTTASVMPSSPELARAMVLPAQARNARSIVEFGPGTGPMTEQLLNGLPEDGRIYSFEINPAFVDYLARHYPDPRLRVLSAGAETVCEALREHGEAYADAVVSSLPMSFFAEALRHQIIGGAAKALGPGGVFTQFQYASGLDCSGRFPKPYDLRPLLGRHFRRVRRHLVWRNLPPAFVYVCTNP